MPMNLVATAQAMCSFGAGPGVVNVLPTAQVLAGNMPAANIMEHKPGANFTTFNMCTSMANPVVASATAAAWGVLTPQPCTPMTASPWVPGSPTVMIANQPALTNSCMANCSYGGVISVVSPAQFQVMSA